MFLPVRPIRRLSVGDRGNYLVRLDKKGRDTLVLEDVCRGEIALPALEGTTEVDRGRADRRTAELLDRVDQFELATLQQLRLQPSRVERRLQVLQRQRVVEDARVATYVTPTPIRTAL